VKIATFLGLNFLFSLHKNTKDKKTILSSLDRTCPVGPSTQSPLC